MSEATQVDKLRKTLEAILAWLDGELPDDCGPATAAWLEGIGDRIQDALLGKAGSATP